MRFFLTSYNSIIIFIIGFAISVFLRTPNINKSLGRYHEWLTAHVLETNKIWFDRGIGNCYYSPIYKHDNTPLKEATLFHVLKDKSGFDYYISYPPFCFLISYFYFKVLFLQPSVLGIQVLSIIIHFAASLLILLIGYLLSNKQVKKDIHLPSIIGSFVYIFSSNNLWFHTNVYFADMLAQPLFIGAVYFLLKLLKEGYKGNTNLLWLGVLNFFLLYTEWIGVFFDVVACIIIIIWHFRSFKKVWKPLLVISLTGAISLGLTVAQYVNINGWKPFLETELKKFEERSGKSKIKSYYGNSIKNPNAWKKLGNHYTKGYTNTLNYLKICFLIFIVIVIIFRKSYLSKLKIIAFLLSAIPVSLHIYLFFDFNANHEFSTLKTSFAFSVLIFIFHDTIISAIASFRSKLLIPAYAIVALYCLYVCNKSYQDYIYQNDPKYISPYWELVGKKIKDLRQEDELVFIREWGVPELIFYSEWIPYQQMEYKQALDFLNGTNFNKGIYFDTDKLVLKKITRFYRNGDSTNIRF